MIEKLKSYLGYLSGLAVLVLSALLFRKSRQLETTQSELASEKSTTEIKLNDQAREAAKEHADNLVNDYESARDEYERLKRGD